jgi:cation:H+ antiporter
MEIIIEVLLFIAGLFLLLKGASIFTDNASRIAKGLGVSDIVIGLTLVAFTTSLPELAVSVLSVLRDAPGIAIGNVIGSNIANIGLVLGLAALLKTGIPVKGSELRQGYIMLLITVISVLFIIDGLTPLKGAILVAGLFFYLYYLSRERELKDGIMEKMTEKHGLPRGISLCVIGGAGVLIGAEMIVSSSVSMASALNIPETIIAVGTSLPELATSITAAYKRLEGIALGNIIGSNIFNLMMVMGLSALGGTLTVASGLLYQSIPMMLFLSIMLVFFMKVENRLGKVGGMALLVIYGFFLYMQIIL